MTRQEANRIILAKIAKEIEQSPDLRFHQILINMNINVTHADFDENGRPNGFIYCDDLYAEESSKTLERMEILNN